MNKKICIVYTHHKLGDLIWQLPYIKAISHHHGEKIDLILREKTQAKNILQDLNHINKIYYNEFRKGLFYWVDVFKMTKIFKSEKYDFVYILDKVNKPAIAAKFAKIKNIIGKDTVSAVRSGFFWGYSGLIDNIINLIKKETRKSFKIIITGGFSNLFKNSIKTKVSHNKNITINGLIKISKLIK